MGKKDGLSRNIKQARKPFTDDELRDVCSAARTAYHRHGRIPTLDQIDELCRQPRGKIAQVISSEVFIHAMTASGIDWKLNKGLTAQQNYVLMIMTDPTDRRSFPVRLRDAGVTSTTYRAWMKQPLFAGLINEFAEAALGEHMHVAHDSLMKKVAVGDMRAVEFYYAMTGRYDPNQRSERDVQAVIGQVLEIITSEVKDTDVLARIATRMQGVLKPGGGGDTRPAPALVGEVVSLEEQLDEGLARPPLDRSEPRGLRTLDFNGPNPTTSNSTPVAEAFPVLEEFNFGNVYGQSRAEEARDQ